MHRHGLDCHDYNNERCRVIKQVMMGHCRRLEMTGLKWRRVKTVMFNKPYNHTSLIIFTRCPIIRMMPLSGSKAPRLHGHWERSLVAQYLFSDYEVIVNELLFSTFNMQATFYWHLVPGLQNILLDKLLCQHFSISMMASTNHHFKTLLIRLFVESFSPLVSILRDNLGRYMVVITLTESKAHPGHAGYHFNRGNLSFNTKNQSKSIGKFQY